MNESNSPKSPGPLFRDVAMLLLVGAALGLTHNWFMLQNGPGKGLAWIKEERKVVKLADVAPPDAQPAVPTPAPPAPAAGTPAPAAAATATPAADVPVIPDSREPMEAELAVVRRLHAANAAVFVDARSAAEYAEGHIAGALNLPFDDVFKKPDLVKGLADRGLPIVCYCGGGDCDLSRNLAFSFLDAGRKRVLVFLGGLPEWKDAALPVKTGDQP
jgi:rhodanese-related sulfurtransferase